jgi:AcrR family transcriptional regulator
MNDRTNTRTQLLDAARSSVRRNGLRGATSRDITATAGANLQSITYHFGSKDELIAEALFGEIERRVRPALDAFDGDVPATQALFGVVQQLVVEFERTKGDAVVYLEALMLATQDAGYRRRAAKLVSTIRSRLTGLIEELRGEGIVPTWVDAEAMASLVLAVANGIVLQTTLDPRGPGHDAMAGQFAGLLLASARTG